VIPELLSFCLGKERKLKKETMSELNVNQNINNTPPRRGCFSCSIPVVLATIALFLVLLFVYNIFSGEAPAPTYPGAEQTELTAEGNKFIDNLYQNSKRENSIIKVFLTKDSAQQVLDYYNSELVTKAQFAAGERSLNQIPNAIVVAFSKKDRIYALVTSNNNDGLVKNQQSNQTYIIIAQGRS